MSVTLQSTAIGPVIVNGETVLSLNDVPALFELLEEDSSLMSTIKAHIKSELKTNIDELNEAIDMEMNYIPSKLYSYIGSYQQLMNIIQQWNQYVATRA